MLILRLKRAGETWSNIDGYAAALATVATVKSMHTITWDMYEVVHYTIVQPIVYEPEPLNGCHWYTKDGIIPLYIFEMAYVYRLLKIMPTSSGAQLLLCWQ